MGFYGFLILITIAALINSALIYQTYIENSEELNYNVNKYIGIMNLEIQKISISGVSNKYLYNINSLGKLDQFNITTRNNGNYIILNDIIKPKLYEIINR